MPNTAGTVVDLLRRLVASQAGALGADDIVLVGLVGRGIQSSRTPAMHEREGARLGIRNAYVLLDFDRLGVADDALAGRHRRCRVPGFCRPERHASLQTERCSPPDKPGAGCSAIGAVNTIVFDAGMRTGYNTDSWGFSESFRESMAGCALDRVVQFGAGGAGAAVAFALIELGVAELAIVDSDPSRSQSLAKRMSSETGANVRPETATPRTFDWASGIVNATPVGMAKYPGIPFSPEFLSARHWLAEIIYFPQETELLRQARALGCRTLAGSGMAVYQAVRAFELFTGRAPDRAAMAGHFEAAA